MLDPQGGGANTPPSVLVWGRHPRLLAAALFVAGLFGATGPSAGDTPSPFMVGADVSWVQEQEDQGHRFFENNAERDILATLHDQGINWIRLRLFHDPRALGGYSPAGHCDLPHTLVMAKRAKAVGLKFLLDLHYSDTWADPGQQRKPAAWASLHGPALAEALREYTRDVVAELVAGGAAPDMVQIGNEINAGVLWPDGKVWETHDWKMFCGLLKAGAAGVREVDPSIPILLHLACGGQNAQSRDFLDRVLAGGVDFDVIGQSYYPEWHGTLEDLKANLTDLAYRYSQPLMVVECRPSEMGAVRAVVEGLPDGKGRGVFIWEPTRGGAVAEAEAETPSPPKFLAEFEAGPVWQTVNDVESPNDGTATRFSLVDLVGSGPWFAARAYFTWRLAPRHALRALVAPLSITETGTLADSVRFEGTPFAGGEPTKATYKFNSYRITYRYLLRESPRWNVWIGLTAKIRDAKIALRQEGTSAEKTDVGFVPLLHFGARYRMAQAWHAVLDVDALAGGPGRAEDAALKLAYSPSERVSVSLGYRMVEGGADVDAVYSFAWFHYLVMGAAVGF